MAKKSTKSSEKSTVKTEVLGEDRVNKSRMLARSKLTKRNVKVIAITAVALLFVLLLWQYTKARNELKKSKNPDVAIQEEGRDTQAEVSKVMVLPKTETPTVANISDVSKLKDRTFFANAENGDKVLIYKEAKKAIIYRPSSKQIVEVATYNSEQDPTK